MTDSRHDRREFLPPRTVPLLYFGVARVALLAALLAAAREPVSVAAFFYHTRMFALVHLVTLGWLTCSILGSLYIVGPFALRIALPAGKSDYLAALLASTAVAGTSWGFWSNRSSVVGWSGALLVLAVVIVGTRVVRALGRAPVPRAIVVHVGLAFLNFMVAGAAGIALAFSKTSDVLPGSALSNMYAHAHLAAIGWVGLMAVGIGYRLFPMVLPAAMPEGRGLYASALLLEGGTLGLVAGLTLRVAPLTTIGALAVALGFGAFVNQVRRMLRSPKPRPVALPSPDYGALQSLSAVAFLVVAVALGLYLTIVPVSEWSLRLGAAYGVLGLIGFFAQLVAGMEYRLLPYYAWYWAFANTDFKGPAPNPHEMPIRGLQRAAFFLWLGGVPLLAAGMVWLRPAAVGAAAWMLLALSFSARLTPLPSSHTRLPGRPAPARAPAPARQRRGADEIPARGGGGNAVSRGNR